MSQKSNRLKMNKKVKRINSHSNKIKENNKKEENKNQIRSKEKSKMKNRNKAILNRY